MPVPARLNHRHQPSVAPNSLSCPVNVSRPTLPRILTTSASNAVHLSRSTARPSRRVRTHWFTHFLHTWCRSSRTSKLLLIFSPTIVALQIIACALVLAYFWEMYCDQPLRIFLAIHALRLAISSPLSIYLHIISRRSPLNSDLSRIDPTETYTLTGLAPDMSAHPPSPPADIPTNERQRQLAILTAWFVRIKAGLDIFAFLWFIVGNYLIYSSNNCLEAAMPLYYLSFIIIIYDYLIILIPILLCTAVIFCFPCVLVCMRVLHVSDGIQMGGSTNEEIATIPVYKFKAIKPNRSIKPPRPPSTTGGPEATTVAIEMAAADTLQDNATSSPLQRLLDKIWQKPVCGDPSSEAIHETDLEALVIPNEKDPMCVICLSAYEDGDVLCKLWCGHHFHKPCVHEWLVLNSQCPMCKRDSRKALSSVANTSM